MLARQYDADWAMHNFHKHFVELNAASFERSRLQHMVDLFSTISYAAFTMAVVPALVVYLFANNYNPVLYLSGVCFFGGVCIAAALTSFKFQRKLKVLKITQRLEGIL